MSRDESLNKKLNSSLDDVIATDGDTRTSTRKYGRSQGGSGGGKAKRSFNNNRGGGNDSRPYNSRRNNSNWSDDEENNDTVGYVNGVLVSNRIYVGNLPYRASWQDLKDHMRQAGEVAFVKPLTRRDGLSSGAAIVEYTNFEDAYEAIESLHDSELQGRPIQVRQDWEDKNYVRAGGSGGNSKSSNSGNYNSKSSNSNSNSNYNSNRGGNNNYNNNNNNNNRVPSGPRSSSNSRSNDGGSYSHGEVSLYVGNLPWEADWKDLKDLFNAVVKVLHADVMYRDDGKSKGWGIVKVASRSDADEAIRVLDNKDYGGRNLEVRYDNK